MTERIEKALADLRTRQTAGEKMSCPRCGRDTMKPALHTNALSRHADGVYVCDECGTAEAMLDFIITGRLYLLFHTVYKEDDHMPTNPAASPTVSSTVGLKNMVIAELITDTECDPSDRGDRVDGYQAHPRRPVSGCCR